MKAAFIGFSQSGKSTLASAVSGQVPPVGAPQVHRLVVKVPDERLNVLTAMYNPKKTTEANIEFIDVPGFSLSDGAGQEEWKRYLPDIRQAELLVAVLRDFDNPSVPAYRDRVDPKADLEEIRDELLYADLETVTNRIERVEKSLKKPTKTHEQEKRELAVLQRAHQALENTTPLSEVLAADEDRRTVASFGLLTLKPLVAVFNVSDDQASNPDPEPPPHAVGAVSLCAAAEWDISQLPPGDRAAFLADLGVETPARDRLIRKCYEALGLISFLTVGPDEVRAWTIPSGGDAVEAARKIHSDIARGFIRAETVAYADLMADGDMKGAKAAGHVRQEGKTYIVQDGDIINFKFNV
jgi:hypothetical protein